jgi:hypothetical protein
MHNLNRFVEFFNIAKTLETKGLKLLHNIKIYWISIFNLLKQVLVEYNVLVVKMHPKASPHKNNLDLLCDLELIFGLPYMVPMLEMVHTLIKFA